MLKVFNFIFLLLFSNIVIGQQSNNCYPFHCVEYKKIKNYYQITFLKTNFRDEIVCYVAYQGKKRYFILYQKQSFYHPYVDRSNLYSFRCDIYNKNLSWFNYNIDSLRNHK